MSGIDVSSYSTSSEYYSSLFSSLRSDNSSSDSTLSDWAAIKNGSYGKLTKAYYNKQSSNTVSKDEADSLLKSNAEIQSGLSALKNSASELISGKLFSEKVTTEKEDGTSTEDYDYEKIYSALKSFVDDYNSVVDKASESDNNIVLRNTLNLTRMTGANSQMLSKVGITIGDGNKLSIDASTAKEADINDLKSLFEGSGSYAGSVDSYVSNIANAINAENNKLSTYSSSGAYVNSTVGSIYDGTY